MRMEGSNRRLSLHWTPLAEGNANFSIVIVFRYAERLDHIEFGRADAPLDRAPLAVEQLQPAQPQQIARGLIKLLNSKKRMVRPE